MPIRILSWNIYYGNVNGLTPVQRLNQIAVIAEQNNVDLVFLQEHPGSGSQFVDANGLLTGANIPNGYQYSVFPEMAGNIANRVSASNRAYAVLSRNTCALGAPAYFQQNSFIQQVGSALRCPVTYQVVHNLTTYNFFNWHNEVGNMATFGMNAFTHLPLPQNTILVGDLNLTSAQINGYAFFNHWDDVVVTTPIQGVDHIMSRLACHPVMGGLLNFVSDANHYPIAADVN
ncbi:endonuclease/exonuclease/phosphatase family protein [Trinickia fusca]|uniref:Endonuclease/exonuclease/phosphatase family protein n=1 Tax=Trinickia fusca TaxID=2419777 RepID=A0A494XWJ9_9BURK|nr:endonuclease/exonuclease/phosphatase family protein [Trinickia fusca]RKP52469.1 endonuclease/exonuclease/phosphatase family protein [Trinickia fusca]